MQSLKLILGKPTAGWLPVDIQADNFDLSFEASDLGHNVIDQLIDVAMKLGNGEASGCYFYLEPAAYILKVKPISEVSVVEVEYLEDFDMEGNENAKAQFNCEVNSANFQKSLVNALQDFLNNKYAEADWPLPEKTDYLK